MTTRLTPILFAALALPFQAGFAAAPFYRVDPDRQPKLADLSGAWDVVSWRQRGEELPGVLAKSCQLVLARGKLTFPTGGAVYRVRLWPAKSPAAIVLTHDKLPGWAGSYRVRGDRLEIILEYGKGLEGRPRDFGGTPFVHFILRRSKRTK